jgi:GT2 family glycosyltransferase
MMLNDLTVVIKTFRRPDCLKAAVESVHRSWSNVHDIIVLDDGPADVRVPRDSRYQLIVTEEDIGLSEGRNRLIDAVQTSLLLLIDDDFVVGPEARIDILAAIVQSGECDLVAPAIRETEGFWNGGWIYRNERGRLYKFHAAHSRRKVPTSIGLAPLYLHDQVNNAFVARTEFVRRVRWDPRLKLREHDDFALRASSIGVIGYTPVAVVDHAPHDPPDYSEIRNDTSRFYDLFLKKWGLTEVVKESEWWQHSPTPPHPKLAT